MLCAKIEARALSSTATQNAIASQPGQAPDAKYRNPYARKNLMHVTILAFVLTYHMILNMVISAVALLVHMAVDANEIRTIAKTSYLMETIAIVTVNVTMEFDVKI